MTSHQVESIESLKRQIESASDIQETKNEIGDTEISPVASESSDSKNVETDDAKIIESDDVNAKGSEKKKMDEKYTEEVVSGKRTRTGQSWFYEDSNMN